MKKIFVLLVTVAALAGCNKFDDLNVSPTALAEPTTRGLLTNVLQNLPGTAFGNNTGNFYVQYLSEGPYPGGSLYSARTFDFAAYYSGPLYDLQKIIEYNTDEATKATFANPDKYGSHDNQVAVARILKAYFFWWLTDRYGDIPYSEALQGAKAFAPAYDKQQAIYTDLFKELKEAAAMIKPAEKAVVGDVMLDGDMGMWKKFAATTRLMMSLRLIKVDFAKGKAEFESAFADGVIANGEDIMYKYIAGDPNNYNPWYNNYSVSNRNDYAISTTMTDYMAPKNDPRLKVYAEILDDTVVGLPYGKNVAVNIPAIYSRIGDYFRGQASPATIYSYAQVLFALAEAAKVGYITGGDGAAESNYYAAIEASWKFYGIEWNTANQAAFATYITEPDVAYTPSTGYKSIMTEKWIHLYLNGYESWVDWRRTGFPVLTPAVDAIDPKGIPLRQGYPTQEKANNTKNYTDVLATMGGVDDNYAKVWWDKD
ncbi:SusD/RagB family nutrient-binding outer membrane lipoprotein [Pseudoflavitalea sp. X16]|uniref:SusD/RagB family nutrient-binding outer membrane lipoprotein n=1 Tax=Paraflavitalea devenefica TaxID=2716334 RepID=UPI00141DAA8D|nr:SusD/RagB family nutrient-binding outer membrane lipoprotein [Paraflavitalea devenefica]NII29906.1 SusD/RagB family nutrient-binding outer membrane lipoprotein [Paraflavitalea devenefica]